MNESKFTKTRIKRDPDIINALIALRRAAKRARETAMQTGTPLALWEDGKVKLVSPQSTGK